MIKSTCCSKSTKASPNVVWTIWFSWMLRIRFWFHCFTWPQVNLPHCIWNNIIWTSQSLKKRHHFNLDFYFSLYLSQCNTNLALTYEYVWNFNFQGHFLQFDIFVQTTLKIRFAMSPRLFQRCHGLYTPGSLKKKTWWKRFKL